MTQIFLIVPVLYQFHSNYVYTIVAFCHTDNNSALTKTRDTPTVSIGSDVCNPNVKCDAYTFCYWSKVPFIICLSNYELLSLKMTFPHMHRTQTWSSLFLQMAVPKWVRPACIFYSFKFQGNPFLFFFMFFLHVGCIVPRRIWPRPSADSVLTKKLNTFYFQIFIWFWIHLFLLLAIMMLLHYDTCHYLHQW